MLKVVLGLFGLSAVFFLPFLWHLGRFVLGAMRGDARYGAGTMLRLVLTLILTVLGASIFEGLLRGPAAGSVGQGGATLLASVMGRPGALAASLGLWVVMLPWSLGIGWRRTVAACVRLFASLGAGVPEGMRAWAEARPDDTDGERGASSAARDSERSERAARRTASRGQSTSDELSANVGFSSGMLSDLSDRSWRTSPGQAESRGAGWSSTGSVTAGIGAASGASGGTPGLSSGTTSSQPGRMSASPVPPGVYDWRRAAQQSARDKDGVGRRGGVNKVQPWAPGANARGQTDKRGVRSTSTAGTAGSMPPSHAAHATTTGAAQRQGFAGRSGQAGGAGGFATSPASSVVGNGGSVGSFGAPSASSNAMSGKSMVGTPTTLATVGTSSTHAGLSSGRANGGQIDATVGLSAGVASAATLPSGSISGAATASRSGLSGGVPLPTEVRREPTWRPPIMVHQDGVTAFRKGTVAASAPAVASANADGHLGGRVGGAIQAPAASVGGTAGPTGAATASRANVTDAVSARVAPRYSDEKREPVFGGSAARVGDTAASSVAPEERVPYVWISPPDDEPDASSVQAVTAAPASVAPPTSTSASAARGAAGSYSASPAVPAAATDASSSTAGVSDVARATSPSTMRDAAMPTSTAPVASSASTASVAPTASTAPTIARTGAADEDETGGGWENPRESDAVTRPLASPETVGQGTPPLTDRSENEGDVRSPTSTEVRATSVSGDVSNSIANGEAPRDSVAERTGEGTARRGLSDVPPWEDEPEESVDPVPQQRSAESPSLTTPPDWRGRVAPAAPGIAQVARPDAEANDVGDADSGRDVDGVATRASAPDRSGLPEAVNAAWFDTQTDSVAARDEPVRPNAPPPPSSTGPSAPESAPRAATIDAFSSLLPEAPLVELPGLDLLEAPAAAVEQASDEMLQETAQLIEQRLREFKVPVTVVGASAGPVITRFEVEPATGVRGSQIVNLMKDLSRGLGLTSVRVVETIPGKTCMGLELPNAQRQMIRLSEILAADVYQRHDSPLAIAMGKDITGAPVVVDLARAPHMLVAGTTGSGKSVAVNAMILSLLFRATPEELRMIMIDPKMLELSVYEGIPHLLAPVVTDMKLAANALNWCVGEMEKRYRLMSAVGVRNLAGYNQKIRAGIASGNRVKNPFSLTPDAPEPLPPLPLIVVIIDELADLMMVAGKKVEELIARLAQKARASGIHLVLATQRPSVDVITGLIKANIPTRVAFQVSSKIDSRTILDQMGAESLLGQGDMLFLPPGSGDPQRVHGAFVADDEVHRVVEYLKQFGEANYEDSILEGPGTDGAGDGESGSADAEADPLYDEAVAFVVRSRKASISAVQRQLRIGYNRAARLVEQMESAGIVSSMGHNGSRDVLVPEGSA